MSPESPGEGILTVQHATNTVSGFTSTGPSGGAAREVKEPPRETYERNYEEFLHAALPQWLAMMDPAPWMAAGSLTSPIDRGNAATPLRQQAATLAIALLAETDRPGCDRDYLRECVRASLIRWQLSLRCDGLPARRCLRRSPLHALIAECILHVLSHAPDFDSDILMGDLDRHVAWIGRRRRRTPWLEATTIALMADTAVLVRDRAMLSRARQRLKRFLPEQDSEGWFSERGGPDLGRLSLVVDALARLHRTMGWGELSKPIQSAVSFILHCIRPDGGVGGCISSCGTGFLSPYGVELVAPMFPEAATLALACRSRLRRYLTDGMPTWHGDLWAILGPRIALASLAARTHTAPPAVAPHQVTGTIRFPHAGISIHGTEQYHAIVGAKNGGALQISWRGGGMLEEPGIIVFFPLGARTAGRWHQRTKTSHSETGVTSDGVLRRPHRSTGRGSSVFKRFRALLMRPRHGGPVRSTGADSSDQRITKPRKRDLFHRDITFGADTIQIRDVVDARNRCQAVLCQSPPGGEASVLVDRDGVTDSGPPLFVEGGRHVEIRRTYDRCGLVSHDVRAGSA